MNRLPAEAANLRFERDSNTGQGLDEALQDAAVASPEPLSLLEHLLSQLYRKQLERNDDFLRWSDYRELGEFQGALANHAETVFSTLDRDEQCALEFVTPHLVTLARGEKGVLNRRTVPYRDLISSPKANNQRSTGAKGLVDRFITDSLDSVEFAKELGVTLLPATIERQLGPSSEFTTFMKDEIGRIVFLPRPD